MGEKNKQEDTTENEIKHLPIPRSLSFSLSLSENESITAVYMLECFLFLMSSRLDVMQQLFFFLEDRGKKKIPREDRVRGEYGF